MSMPDVSMSDESMLALPVRQFLARTASRAAAPGGGAVAALAGAGAAALVSMVGELTAGRKRYRAVEAEVDRLRGRAVGVMQALQEAAVEDGDSYQAYLRASAMPRDDAAAVDRRSREVAAAVVRMTRAPLATAERCAEVLALARKLAPIGAAHAISDAGVALQLAHAALQSALMTVDVNLPFLRDEDLADRIKTRRIELAAAAADDLRAGMEEISARLSG